jgi:hypothetical protein
VLPVLLVPTPELRPLALAPAHTCPLRSPDSPYTHTRQHITRNSSAYYRNTMIHPLRAKMGEIDGYNLSRPSEVCLYVYMCRYVYVMCLLDYVGLDSD